MLRRELGLRYLVETVAGRLYEFSRRDTWGHRWCG